MIAGLLAVFFGWDANHGSKPRKMSLGSLLIVCENGALTSNVDQKSGSEFGSSDVFCWLLPCWKHPWTHHFSIFHHFFTVFLHLSPFLQSFLPSFLIHHLFMVSPHFHAFSCRFSWFFPTFHQKSSRLTSLFFHPGRGASVFDSRALCQELGLAARRSGMLDAGLLLVSFTGEVAAPGGVLSSAEQCWEVKGGAYVDTFRTGKSAFFLEVKQITMENHHFQWVNPL